MYDMSAVRRCYRNAKRRLARKGMSEFHLLFHGAGNISITARQSDGTIYWEEL